MSEAATAPAPVEQKEEDTVKDVEHAMELLAQGKRNILCGEVPHAVNQFQEASRLLAKKYGETANECGDTYLCYGKALLEMSRMESGVLGNALEGIEEEEDEEEEKSEKSDKSSETSDDKVEDPEKITEEEREKISIDVYDAMAERDEEKKAREEKEKKEEGEDQEEAMEEGEKKEESEAKGEEAKKEEGEKIDTKEEAKKDAKDEAKKDAKDEAKKDTKDEAKKDTKDEAKTDTKDEAKKEETKDVEKKEDTKVEEMETEEGETKKDDEGTEAESEDLNTEEEGGDTEEGEAAEGEEKTEEKEGKEGEKKEGEKEEDDDVSNLQLAWEMLELAKIIFKRDQTKEARMKLAEAHLKLGEVALETEQYDSATGDFKECLKIQKDILEKDDRCLAETHYQLGLSHTFACEYVEAISSYKSAASVIEAKIKILENVIEEGEKVGKGKDIADFEDPVYKAHKEIKELREILPDMLAKVEDVKDEQKTAAQAKQMVKEQIGLGEDSATAVSTSAGTSSEEKPANVITHLVRKKRKNESEGDVADDSKKSKTEDGSGDAKVNGSAEKDAKPVEAEAAKS